MFSAHLQAVAVDGPSIFGHGETAKKENFAPTPSTPTPSETFRLTSGLFRTEISQHKVFTWTVSWRFAAIQMMHAPSTAGTFRKNSGKTPETLSESLLQLRSGVQLGSPKPYKSRHLRLPEHFQNSLPPVRLGTPLFSEVGPERASQSRSWNSQQCWGISEMNNAMRSILHHSLNLSCNNSVILGMR